MLVPSSLTNPIHSHNMVAICQPYQQQELRHWPLDSLIAALKPVLDLRDVFSILMNSTQCGNFELKWQSSSRFCDHRTWLYHYRRSNSRSWHLLMIKRSSRHYQDKNGCFVKLVHSISICILPLTPQGPQGNARIGYPKAMPAFCKPSFPSQSFSNFPNFRH